MITPESAPSANLKPSNQPNIWKPLAVVLLLLLMAAAFKVIFIVSKGVLPGYGERILDSIFALSSALGVMFFVRWLIVDAPLTFLRRFTVVPLLKTLISLVLYFITIIYLLHRMATIDLMPLLTTSAVFTGIIALSLQETLKNLVTGISINSERVVAKGDWVNIGGKVGRVMDVTWRTTRLLTPSNDYVYIPNKLLSEGHVENYTYPSPLHIVDVDVGAGYGDQPNRIKGVLLEVAYENSHVLRKPSPDVFLISFADFSINYRLRVWVSDYSARFKVKSDLHSNIWYAFKRHGIDIPFPIRTVYQYQMGAKAVVPEDIKGYLRGMDFLKPLKDADIGNIAATARIEAYGENEIIFSQGVVGDTCYFIKEGAVDIIFKDKSVKDNVVVTLKAGAFFGEMSLLTGEERKTSAVAKKDSMLIVIGSRGFSEVFKENPELMEKLSEIVANRLLKLEETRKKAATDAERIELQKAESRVLLDKIKSFFKIR